jgi:hypothetical protein
MMQSPINEAITFVAAQAAAESLQSGYPSGPALDITFMLSSNEAAPPFTGMRMGGYNKEGDTLFFEAAVPEQITQSKEAPHYVALVMQDMVDNARQYFDELHIDFDFDNWKRVIDNLTGVETGNIVAH